MEKVKSRATVAAAASVDRYQSSSYGAPYASLDELEDYTELLYEELPDKLKATKAILALSNDPTNLETIKCNEPLISALTRVLREESKKSVELASNIIHIFKNFANHSQYHAFIAQNKVGDMCLRITDNELNRGDLWKKDLQKLELKYTNTKDPKLGRDLESEHRKYQGILQAQDTLLCGCFRILYNLSIDPYIEVKMFKRDVISYLLALLDRQSNDLKVLALAFLKKLSIVKENKDKMVLASDKLLDKLGDFLVSDNSALLNTSLRFIYNLSHDAHFRTVLLKNDFLAKLSDMLSQCFDRRSSLLSSSSRGSKQSIVNLANAPESINTNISAQVVMNMLYMLSVEDHAKAQFTASPCLPLLLTNALSSTFSPANFSIESVAILINVSCNCDAAEQIIADVGLKQIMKRSLKTRDPLMLKLVANLANAGSTDLKLKFLDYVDDLMHIMLTERDWGLKIEILNVLNALTIANFDWGKLSEHYNLLPWIIEQLSRILADGRNLEESGKEPALCENDDVALALIVLIGNMAVDEGIVASAIKHDVINTLMEVMVIKEDDDEIILQVVYALYQFLLHEETRTILIDETKVVSYLIDLLYDRNARIRNLCDACLDIIAEISDEWVAKIRGQKFHFHNQSWINYVTLNYGYDGVMDVRRGADIDRDITMLDEEMSDEDEDHQYGISPNVYFDHSEAIEVRG